MVVGKIADKFRLHAHRITLGIIKLTHVDFKEVVPVKKANSEARSVVSELLAN